MDVDARVLTRDFLGETPVPANVVAQVSARQVVHDEVEVLAVLERVVHVHDERVFQLRQDLPLVYHRLDTALGDDTCLAHLFHGEVLFGLFALDSPDLAEAALADAEVIDKVGLGDRYKKEKRQKVFVSDRSEGIE